MRIDAHQHFWDLKKFRYGWMQPDSPLHRDYLPEHLEPILIRNRFERSIVVQAHQSVEEARWLLQLANQHEFIAGVVGWVDLTDPHVGTVLDDLQRDPKFVGVRHLVQDEPDTRWLLRNDVIRGLRELARRGIPYDLLLFPVHLQLAPLLAERVPELRMVIDHIAKPRIAEGLFDGWAQDMEAAAAVPHLYCKLSGMITEAEWKQWNAAQLRPYVQHVLKLFGPERLMFGSDWPVCTLAGTWKEVLAAFTQAVGPLPQPVREELLGGAAARFYRV